MSNLKKLLKSCSILLICLLYVVFSGQPVFAELSADDLKAINNGTTFYDPNAVTNCSIQPGFSASSGNINLQGNDNAEKAWNYFIAKGLTPEQAAGVVGNLQHESGINPVNKQGAGDNPQDPSGVKVGWGIMQWTPGSKVIGLAKQAGVSSPIYELGSQLDIVWWHLNNTSPTGRSNVLPGLKATTTIEKSTAYFEEYMEGAGIVAMASRVNFARQFYAKFSGKTAPPIDSSVALTDPNSVAGCPTSTGIASSLNGFTVYSQYDPAWKDKPYSISTVGESGCGPSAMAMIITTLTGQPITPDITAAYATTQDLYQIPTPENGNRGGSKWNIAPVLAKNWGLKADKISKNITAITQAVGSGKFVIMSGSGEKPFSSGGHYLVIRGIDSSGKLLIGDSGHKDTSTEAWDAQQLLGNANEGSVYAIYK